MVQTVPCLRLSKSVERRNGWSTERVKESVWTAIHPEFRESVQISPLTFFWAQRSSWTEVAQNWHSLPQRCQGQPLYRGVAGAYRCFVFQAHLTSWFWKGGLRIIKPQKSALSYLSHRHRRSKGIRIKHLPSDKAGDLKQVSEKLVSK